MFITVKRHEREKQGLIDAGNRLTDAILEHSDQGLFLLDSKDKVLPQISRSLATLFRREDFTNLTFEKLLAPVVSAKTLTVVRNHIAGLLANASHEGGAERRVLKDIEVRLTNPDGSTQTAHYWFDFDPVDTPHEPPSWLVRVTDITMQVETIRELEDLRSRTQTQGEILRGVLQMGGARFGMFLQKTDASMKTINTVLKKSAREEDAFRSKLEETLEEVDRVRREAAAFKLTGLESAARVFEDSLHDLRSRTALSGSDFLPLAVKLDQLYSQFALVKSLTVVVAPVREPESPSRMTDQGTQIIEAPRFMAETQAATAAGPLSVAESVPVHAAHRAAPAGSLDNTLQALTDHVAQEQKKEVLLESRGLDQVPAKYQATIKNVAIQLIRNAVMHGIETPATREAAGKALHGTLRLEFRPREDAFELTFEDDGRGLSPDQVRATAVQRGIITAETAARMRDREAIKLIFKSRFTTLGVSPTDTTHGAGMSLVRRYVHEAGGKIALASLPGHETRFKIMLPALPDEPVSSGDLELADDARVA
jgi:two-component system, chemotaxis family, sensor kinase CheA